MNIAETILAAIDASTIEDEAKQKPFRPHLGGSLIGRPCDRELWYSFRWAAKPSHEARMLRLFARGQREEAQFIRYLRRIGLEVREFSERLMYHEESDSYVTIPWRGITTPPSEPEIEALCQEVTEDPLHVERAEAKGVKLKQWRIFDVNNHFSGSLDGIMLGVPGLDPNEQVLLEFKTHNTKSFVALKNADGPHKVKQAKPQHWGQMQIYMHKKQLKFALYMAVNKNDDDIYLELVEYDPLEGPLQIEKAQRIIAAKQPPNRIGMHPAWFDCKFCDFKQVCHYAEPMLKNCRTCIHSSPVEEGQWRCGLWNAIIPSDVVFKGCDNGYKQITD